jgi:hypothetical protein
MKHELESRQVVLVRAARLRESKVGGELLDF